MSKCTYMIMFKNKYFHLHAVEKPTFIAERVIFFVFLVLPRLLKDGGGLVIHSYPQSK